MQTKNWIGAIDQGTTSTRLIIFDDSMQIVSKAQVPIKMKAPKMGWTEQDPAELVESIVECARLVSADLSLKLGQKGDLRLRDHIRAIGFTNQRETTIGWHEEPGSSKAVLIGPAIVWNDTRTDGLVKLMRKNYDDRGLQEITGLPISAYFSALKIRWMMDNFPVDLVKVRFGTVNSWIQRALLVGSPHITDHTNACRTLLYDLRSGCWSETMCHFFGIPVSSLPTISQQSTSEIGVFNEDSELEGIPLLASLGDQHAALLGHGCVSEGMTKLTYGTGCFLLQNTAEKLYPSEGPLTTLATEKGEFALEVPIAMAGIGLEWLRSSLKILDKDPKAIDRLGLIELVNKSEVSFVPALRGLLAPYWDATATASFHGLTLETGREQLVLALLESIAFSCKQGIDLLPFPPKTVMVDGGLTNCHTLMSLQRALLPAECKLIVSDQVEATALGAALAVRRNLGLPLIFPQSKEISPTDPSLASSLDSKYRSWLQLMMSKFGN